MRKLTSLQWRLTFLLGLAGILLCAPPIGYYAWTVRRGALETARFRMQVVANRQAEAIGARFETAMDAARTLAGSLSINLAPGQRLTRAQANAQVRRVLEQNPDFLGAYTLWEPDAFDGQDAAHRLDPQSDGTGRFLPYWNRGAGGDLQVEPIVNYASPGQGDFYQIPRATLREAVIEPYVYPVRGRPIFMTSMVVPILDGRGTFRGIAGVDLRVDFLQQLADAVDVYDHSGRLFLLTGQRMVAGATAGKAMVGHPWAPPGGVPGPGDLPDAGVQGMYSWNRNLCSWNPIRVGRTAEPWVVLLEVPERVIMRKADRQIALLVASAAAAVLLGIGVILVLLRRTVVARIRTLTAATEALAAGDYHATCDVPGGDELHRLGEAFNLMAARVAESVGALQEREALLKGGLDQSFG